MSVRVATMRDREIIFQLMGVLPDDSEFHFNVSMRQEEGGDEACRWLMTKRASLSI